MQGDSHHTTAAAQSPPPPRHPPTAPTGAPPGGGGRGVPPPPPHTDTCRASSVAVKQTVNPNKQGVREPCKHTKAKQKQEPSHGLPV